MTVTNLFLYHEEHEPTNGRQAAYQAAESKVIDNSMKKKRIVEFLTVSGLQAIIF